MNSSSTEQTGPWAIYLPLLPVLVNEIGVNMLMVLAQKVAFWSGTEGKAKRGAPNVLNTLASSYVPICSSTLVCIRAARPQPRSPVRELEGVCGVGSLYIPSPAPFSPQEEVSAADVGPIPVCLL